jgi:hypothetical protein
MNRYKELKYQDKTYTESSKIEEILIKCKFDWFLDCEVENVRLEIMKNTLVFNAGVFFNGTWVYGVFRDGQWKYGTWEGGVWYNGTWYNGIFKNGIIFDGRFIGGKIEGGEIRGGEFFDVNIGREVVDSTIQKTTPQPQGKPQGIPSNRGIEQKIQGQSPEENPQIQKVQPQKIEEKIIKDYESFLYEKKSIINEEVQHQFKIEGATGIFGLQKYMHDAANYYNVKIWIDKEDLFLNITYNVIVEGDVNDINNFVEHITTKVQRHKNS